MDAIRFDALTRALAAGHARRSLSAVVAGATAASFLSWFGFAAEAGCKKVGAHCKKNGNCCAGARCRHGRCRCKKGWVNCNGEGLCRNLAADAANCGACGTTCATGCCAGGACHDLCGGDCCAECFAEANAPKPKGSPNLATAACCAAASVCNNGTGDPEDDLCCWPDEVCIDGHCCCNGCQGLVVCGGTCCPAVSCCHGKCCGADQVCARTKPNKPKSCVSAYRSCATDGECFVGEKCWGGSCCSGGRICFKALPAGEPVCCPLGKHCDGEECCDNGVTCVTTGKKVRIRL